MKIFISHSGDDEELVNMFRDLLIQDFHINQNEIFCSSIVVGEDFNIKIKENLQASKVVLLLITPNFMKSNYCLMEMGAAWINKDYIVPIITPPLSYNILDDTPLKTIQAIMFDDYESIFDQIYQYIMVDKKIIERFNSVQEKNLLKKLKCFTENVKIYIKENFGFDSSNSNEFVYSQKNNPDVEKCPLYIDAQIRAIRNAKKSIYISMDSLNPESTNLKLIEFDKLLENAKNNDVTIKIITRTGTEPERSRGAYDICDQHDLEEEMKFLDILNAKNLRFTLVDDEEVIISSSKGTQKGFSKNYAHLYNETLNGLLKKYFTDICKRNKVLSYKEFILRRLDEIGVKSMETSVKRASEILDIPEKALRNILNEENIKFR